MPEVQIVKVPQWGYIVASRSIEGAWWMVQGGECTCPAGVAGAERCWHRSKVAEMVAAENRHFARPVVPPHVSALVD